MINFAPNVLVPFVVLGFLVLAGAAVIVAVVIRRMKRTEYALQIEKELAQVERSISACSGGKPFGSPFSMSSLCANS